MNAADEILGTREEYELGMEKLPTAHRVMLTQLQNKAINSGMESVETSTSLLLTTLSLKLQKLEAKYEALRKAYTTMIGDYNED